MSAVPIVTVGCTVKVAKGRLKGEGGEVTRVHDQYGETYVVFDSWTDGRRRSCQLARVEVVAEGNVGEVAEAHRGVRLGTLEEAIGTPAEAARSRIETCERFGLEVDPEDVRIASGGAS